MSTAKRKVKEIWKTPPSVNRPWIEVSNLGRVRTLPHKTTVGSYRSQCRIRKMSVDTRGRPFVSYWDKEKGRYKNRLLRVLVAECFLKDYREDLYVSHKNSDVGDCRASNLNMIDKEKRYDNSSQNSSKMVIVLKPKTGNRKEFIGCGKAAKFLGVTKQSVHSALLRRGTCCGYKVMSRKK